MPQCRRDQTKFAKFLLAIILIESLLVIMVMTWEHHNADKVAAAKRKLARKRIRRGLRKDSGKSAGKRKMIKEDRLAVFSDVLKEDYPLHVETGVKLYGSHSLDSEEDQEANVIGYRKSPKFQSWAKSIRKGKGSNVREKKLVIPGNSYDGDVDRVQNSILLNAIRPHDEGPYSNSKFHRDRKDF